MRGEENEDVAIMLTVMGKESCNSAQRPSYKRHEEIASLEELPTHPGLNGLVAKVQCSVQRAS